MIDVDDLLLEARQESLRIEQLAAHELRQNFHNYIPPSQRAYRLVDGYERYARSGNTDLDDFFTMRQAFTETQGVSNKAFSRVLGSFASIGPFDYSRTMFNARPDWNEYVRAAAAYLRRDGFFKFGELLPADFVTSVRKKIVEQMDEASGGRFSGGLDGSDRRTPQYKSNFDQLVTIDELYALGADPVLRAVVAEYLEINPILNTPVAFLNVPCDLSGHADLSATAQLYHHDLDRLGFVKLFVYLTDVDEGCGPHAVIPGTHRNRPAALWEDGRHPDDELAREGVLDSEVRICGAAGTVFLVDTSMLHKGVHPVERSRLVLQIQYVNSLFGRPISESNRKVLASRFDDSHDVQVAAELVRRTALDSGMRLMQNLI